MSLYQQDVRTLSDAELELLSAEILAVYAVDDYDESLPYDNDASDRYYEFRREIERRRWDALTPAEQAEEKKRWSLFTRIALQNLEKNLDFAKVANRHFDKEFSTTPKIGAVLHIRKPVRLLQVIQAVQPDDVRHG